MTITKSEILLEKNRQELLSKQKSETPERIQRASNYSISKISIESEALLNDWLVITTNISGNSSTYNDSIAFKNVMTELIALAKIDSKHYVNSKLIIRSIKRSLDKNDIYINCTCDDFKYRYAYHATQGKFKWGKLQNSNGQKIRNPNNDIGCMCKHLYALLRSNTFLEKVSDTIMRTIMANLDVLVKRFKINLEEFIVNSERYDRMLKMNIGRTKTGQFTKKDSEESNEDKKQENVDFTTDENNIDFNIEKILQYYTNYQTLEMLMELLSEDDYLTFIKMYAKKSNESLEDYLANNVSISTLLHYIKEFNNNIYETLINNMFTNIF